MKYTTALLLLILSSPQPTSAAPDDAAENYHLGAQALAQYLDADPNAQQTRPQLSKTAETHFARCLESAPDNRNAYYKLALLYLETDRPTAAVSLMKRLLQRFPNDQNALLDCGLAYRYLGGWPQAERYFTQAFKYMAPQMRSAMFEPPDIASPLETTPEKDAQFQAERARYWHAHDPLLLTKINERLIDHYSRVAYANLRYGDPEHSIKGYETDMGKTHIRFGFPLKRVRSQPSALASPRETWYYENSQIAFETDDPEHPWHFASETEKANAGLTAFKKHPPRFEDPFQSIEYQPPHEISAFREGVQMRLEIAYALPENRVKIQANAADVTDGLFLFDSNWNEVQHDTKPLQNLPALGADSLRKTYLLIEHTLQIKPGDYTLVAELLDHRTPSLGAIRATRSFAVPDTGLALSDLLLASQITSDKSFPENRSDLHITPNPLRTYTQKDPVFLYLETYNLHRDVNGRTRYDITYRVGLPEKTDIDPGLFMPLNAQRDTLATAGLFDAAAAQNAQMQGRVQYRLPQYNQTDAMLGQQRDRETRIGTAVSAQYQSIHTDDFTFIQIGVTRLPPGIYALDVAVADRLSNARTQKRTLFRVIH